jgi:hypothetical protein
MNRLLTLVAMLCVSTGALSEELTLVCQFVGSERPGLEREKEVNQLYIDTELPAVELRIAQTMGTSKPFYFGFRNRKVNGMTDDKILLYFLGSMVWAGADESGSRAYRYKCGP